MSIVRIKSAEDPRMVRLWNRDTKSYLHLSGQGETTDVNHSWLGFAHQTDALRQRASARAEGWPYVRRSRNDHLSPENFTASTTVPASPIQLKGEKHEQERLFEI